MTHPTGRGCLLPSNLKIRIFIHGCAIFYRDCLVPFAIPLDSMPAMLPPKLIVVEHNRGDRFGLALAVG